MKSIPPIKAVMTAVPYYADASDPLDRARELMREHHIRHLPVVRDGKPISIITVREIDVADGAAGTGRGGLRVADVCRPEAAYVVELNEPLDVVALRMADRHADAALVVKDGRLIGIFTHTDVCRCLGDLLRTLFPREPGHDAA